MKSSKDIFEETQEQEAALKVPQETKPSKQMANIDKLRARTQPDEIVWKVQSYTKDKTKTIIVPYLTARSVFHRFDEAFGPLGWSTDVREVSGGYVASITAGGVTRTDGANNTDIEPIKGGISDGLKRCAVQFGFGRDLYTYPRVMLKGKVSFIPDEIIARLKKMTEAINAGKYDKKLVILDTK